METVNAEIALREASVRLIQRTPGATNLDDVARLTGRPWGDLLAEESDLPRDLVRRITGA